MNMYEADWKMRLNVRERLIAVIINTHCVAIEKKNKHARTHSHTHFRVEVSFR